MSKVKDRYKVIMKKLSFALIVNLSCYWSLQVTIIDNGLQSFFDMIIAM